MAAAPISDRAQTRPSQSRRRAGTTRLLLAAAILGSTGSGGAAGEPPPPPTQIGLPRSDPAETASLDHLSATVDDLTARLHAVRDSLDDMRDAARRPTASDAAALARLHAERDRTRATAAATCAARQGAEAWSAEDTARLRNELSKLMVELGRVRRERATLEGRIAELQEAAATGRPRNDLAISAGRDTGTPLAPPPASEGQALSTPTVVPPAAAERATGKAALSGRPKAVDQAANEPVDTLQLEAKLALAELKIAGLVSDLRSAQASREGIEAEAASLRAMTDARIRRMIEGGQTSAR
jgi:outer membrane murein-binding lipoprotein Lpp